MTDKLDPASAHKAEEAPMRREPSRHPIQIGGSGQFNKPLEYPVPEPADKAGASLEEGVARYFCNKCGYVGPDQRHWIGSKTQRRRECSYHAALIKDAPMRPNTEKQLGALAQAARNYLLTGDPRDKVALDRLAAEALGTDRLWYLCLDCGALVGTGGICESCGLGDDQ